MTFEEARQTVKTEWRTLIPNMAREAIKNVNGETSYICPKCNHGANGDGLTFIPGSNTLKCFACNFSGDIIDLYEQTNNVGHREAVLSLSAMYGITVDDEKTTYSGKNDRVQRAERALQASGNIQTPPTTKNAENAAESVTESDNTEYYKKCAAQIEKAAEYLSKRGLSMETAQRYGLGFDADSYNEWLLIPVNKSYWIKRNTDASSDRRYQNAKGAKADIFNKKALYAHDVQEVFVTEGAIDALSIIEVGFTAVALNSTSNVKMFLDTLKEKPTSATLIVCMDNDENKAGQKASAELAQGLKELNLAYIEATDIYGEHKDANEYLVADRVSFIGALKEAQHAASSKPDNIAYYINKMLFQRDIEDFKNVKSTGFENIDKEAGGLYPGLYSLAAISSLGKTTLAHQMADNLAIDGNDVLFFSLEQSRFELVSKSISRTMAQADKSKAMTSLEIRRGENSYAATSAALVYAQSVKDRMNIIEGNFKCDISFIGDYVRQYAKKNNTRPVVFIDYLQILQPTTADQKKSVRDAVDTSVTELKRLSRELNITIIVISSVNRSNYLTPIDFESLKESGGIEYTCDVVWGLQLACLDDPIFESKSTPISKLRETVKIAKAASPRKIKFVCLKNRYGKANFECNFEYFPEYDLFVPNNKRR